jgi:hypothetical protein
MRNFCSSFLSPAPSLASTFGDIADIVFQTFTPWFLRLSAEVSVPVLARL